MNNDHNPTNEFIDELPNGIAYMAKKAWDSIDRQKASLETIESKKMEVINKFRKDFVENFYNYNPELRAIIELLVRDVDPYKIIEQLIEQLKKSNDHILKLYQEGIRFPQPRQ